MRTSRRWGATVQDLHLLSLGWFLRKPFEEKDILNCNGLKFPERIFFSEEDLLLAAAWNIFLFGFITLDWIAAAHFCHTLVITFDWKHSVCWQRHMLLLLLLNGPMANVGQLRIISTLQHRLNQVGAAWLSSKATQDGLLLCMMPCRNFFRCPIRQLEFMSLDTVALPLLLFEKKILNSNWTNQQFELQAFMWECCCISAPRRL